VHQHSEEVFIVLALVGMPGSGKSTVGRQIARKIGCAFVDSDHVIEQRLGCSIKEYFERQGEAAFRDMESQTLDDITRQAVGVLATGGGAVLRPANRALLRERTTVCYLRVTPEEIFRRLRHDRQRPLLQVDDPEAKLRELFAQRDPLYQETAHYVIESHRPRIPTMVTMVMSQLELAGLLPLAETPPHAT
jgi:shikimate kinase